MARAVQSRMYKLGKIKSIMNSVILHNRVRIVILSSDECARDNITKIINQGYTKGFFSFSINANFFSAMLCI